LPTRLCPLTGLSAGLATLSGLAALPRLCPLAGLSAGLATLSGLPALARLSARLPALAALSLVVAATGPVAGTHTTAVTLTGNKVLT
jgi:hypothetical protein